MKMEQAKFLCPWRTIKTTEIEKGLCSEIKKTEKVDFGRCLGRICPFYNNILELCNRAKNN